jgi:xanthine dehydrogenase molybdopterin-binding subunit B
MPGELVARVAAVLSAPGSKQSSQLLRPVEVWMMCSHHLGLTSNAHTVQIHRRICLEYGGRHSLLHIALCGQ